MGMRQAPSNPATPRDTKKNSQMHLHRHGDGQPAVRTRRSWGWSSAPCEWGPNEGPEEKWSVTATVKHLNTAHALWHIQQDLPLGHPTHLSECNDPLAIILHPACVAVSHR